MVLMDEPLGTLDKQLREQLQLEIRRIQRALGTTAVYVTHDQQEALTMSDRVAVFHEGRIRQIGTPEDLYERPQSIFVARFVGESNLFEGRVTSLAEETCSVVLDDGLAVEARMVDRLVVGERCALSLRPESITAASPSEAGDNLFTAPVTDVVYQGDHRRVQLTLSVRTELFLKVFAEPGRARLKVGDQATVRWSADDCLAFREA
jgi:putative spermidine/putrescine transport system ATP-binding protein